MPEDFSSLLDALAAEGRGVARPLPAGAIEASGRVRRRRRRNLTAVTSALAACAVAGGVTWGFGGSHGGSAPIVPGGVTASPIPPPGQSPNSQVTIDTSRFLQNDEAPNPGAFQWKIDVAMTTGLMGVEFGLCGNGPTLGPPHLRAKTEDVAQYRSPYAAANSFESIFHYPSAEAAQQDFAMLTPDPAKCSGTLTGHVTGTVPDGFAWVQSWPASNGGRPAAEHALVVHSGDTIAYWRYQDEGQGTPYDTADDQKALQRMADRLDGRTPVPATNTAPPPDAIPDSAWLDALQIPFATADKSHGWYQMGTTPPQPGDDQPSDLCSSAGLDIVTGKDATIAEHMFHGTPDTTPAYPGSNYLYSGANQSIATFPTAERARAAFTTAKQLTSQHGCTYTDTTSHHKITRAVKVGTVSPSGFSLQVDDTPGSSHIHLYVVAKGTHVSTLFVSFEQGDNTTAGDAAVLAAMTARLP
ncbi:hypothetical protein [Catenulispora subtropica]|uniref:Uncharacterized protein n=1 Tax=Catenulispora subtropica TaxID=450798 RepID=A0ABN2SLC4_9ACTN